MSYPPLPAFRYLDHPILVPQPGVPWASEMVLNPAVIDDPTSGRLHLLFRATGPMPATWLPDRPQPFPIYLGYAYSEDEGRTWQADFRSPCLSPALRSDAEAMRIRVPSGAALVNHANGCIEDPRLTRVEGRVYLTTACRLFPPGPYWEHDEPMQCAPDWARSGHHTLGRAAAENLTVSVLWEVDLRELTAGNYGRAFTYLTHLSDPQRADNRDVFPFPQRVRTNGVDRYLVLHRPFDSAAYGRPGSPPAIFVAAAEKWEDFPSARAEHRLLAAPRFEWEGNRIGASWPPLALPDHQWLLAYHGKQDNVVGYTQSFMILGRDADGWPQVIHRCPDRLMYARQPWELAGPFTIPCVFTCGGIVRGPDLLMSYGAADHVSGVAWAPLDELVAQVRRFDASGQLI